MSAAPPGPPLRKNLRETNRPNFVNSGAIWIPSPVQPTPLQGLASPPLGSPHDVLAAGQSMKSVPEQQAVSPFQPPLMAESVGDPGACADPSIITRVGKAGPPGTSTTSYLKLRQHTPSIQASNSQINAPRPACRKFDNRPLRRLPGPAPTGEWTADGDVQILRQRSPPPARRIPQCRSHLPPRTEKCSEGPHPKPRPQKSSFSRMRSQRGRHRPFSSQPLTSGPE